MPKLSEAKKITLGTTPVKALWLGNKKIWPLISEDLRKYLATIDQLFFTTDNSFTPWGKAAYPRVNGNLSTSTVTYGISTKFPATLTRSSDYDGSTTNAFQLNAVANGDCLIRVVSGGRECIRVEVSGSNVRVSTSGDRGQRDLSFTVYWPGGTHLLSISTMQDWYGYRIKALIDGVQVETASNGGALYRSENLFVGGSASISGSGNLIVLTGAQRALLDNDETASFLANSVGAGSVSWTKYETSQTIKDPVQQYFGASPSISQGWLFSGGVGGASYLNGAAGNSVWIPKVEAGDVLKVGAGGSAKSVTSGNPGEPSILSGVSSATASTRITPFLNGGSPEFTLPGAGGKVATSEKPATAGSSGGLVLARVY